MGNLSIGVTISAALHAAVVAWAATRELTRGTRDADDERDDDVATATPVEIVDVPAVSLVPQPTAPPQPPATPHDLTYGTSQPPSTAPPSTASVDMATTTVPAPSTPSPPRSTPSGDMAQGTSPPRSTPPGDMAHGTTAVETATSPEPRGGGTRSPYFDMRRGERTDLTLPATRDDLDRAPAGTSPAAGERASGKLAPDGRGRKSDQGSFVAKVDADGDVTIEDRRDFSIRWAVPMPKQIGRGIAEWYESDKGPDGKRGKRTLENEVSGGIDQATVGCEGVRDAACAPDRTRTFIIPVFRGGFNPTDWLMRRTAGDPYASRKRAYLDETREERAQIRAAHRAEQLERTAVIVRENLERAWASTTDARVRKQLLFELWDEIVEPRDEDSAVARASRAARAQVIGFIRARLPHGGADAYRTEELAALNARRKSSATFSPYE